MNIIVAEDVIKMFPDLAIGVVVAKNVVNQGVSDELKALTWQRVQKLRAFFANKNFKEDPRISSWREAYRKMGVSPKKHPPTSEAFVKRALKSDSLPEISAAVNAYLASEIDYLLPIGGYDLAVIEGDITLCVGPGGDKFEPLGGGPEEEVSEGEIIYRDSSRVLTRRWNYRDADPTKITMKTKELILCTESVSAAYGPEYLEDSVSDISALLKQFCSADTLTKTFRAEQSPIVGID